MRTLRSSLFLFLILLLLAPAADPVITSNYSAFNSEMGVVYRPPALRWDAQQWNAVFRDPAPPAGWVLLALGRESCSAIPATWLNNAKRKGLKLGILIDSPLNPREIEKIVDCSANLGFRRAIVDEYVTYNIVNKRPLCAILSEMRNLANRIRARHPGFEFGIDENWHIWMENLRAGQADNCGSYPYFKVDYAGLSVFTKYGNPSGGVCGHPTSEEMQEQLIDLKRVVRDYSRSGRTFVWQLNQNWYPGGESTLQFFRQAKAIYGYDRFFLYGPTNGNDVEENWAYNTPGVSERCPGVGYEWFLPAREYLIRISEGRPSTIRLTGPDNVSVGSRVDLSGLIQTNTGIAANNIQLQEIPPAGTVQNFSVQTKAASGAFLAIVGVRVNSQLPDNIKGAAEFSLLKAGLYETGKTKNLVRNGDFDDDFRDWLVSGNASIRIAVDEFGKSLSANSSANQFVSVTSLPIPVIPGRSYTASFDARLFQEARNSGYFFVAWLRPNEVRRDRLFMNFPNRRTIAETSSGSNGRFSFEWQPQERGTYSLLAFFGGTRAIQPCISQIQIASH